MNVTTTLCLLLALAAIATRRPCARVAGGVSVEAHSRHRSPFTPGAGTDTVARLVSQKAGRGT